MNNFEYLRASLPKLKSQFITPKISYCAKTETEIIIKIDRSKVLVLKNDGTYTLTTHKELHKDAK